MATSYNMQCGQKLPLGWMEATCGEHRCQDIVAKRWQSQAEREAFMRL